MKLTEKKFIRNTRKIKVDKTISTGKNYSCYIHTNNIKVIKHRMLMDGSDNIPAEIIKLILTISQREQRIRKLRADIGYWLPRVVDFRKWVAYIYCRFYLDSEVTSQS